jgi:hypothetical protein
MPNSASDLLKSDKHKLKSNRGISNLQSINRNSGILIECPDFHESNQE